MPAPLAPHKQAAVETRYHQAVWYAFGREDERGDHVDALGFARFAEAEARAFYSEERTMLDSITDQWIRWSSGWAPITTREADAARLGLGDLAVLREQL